MAKKIYDWIQLKLDFFASDYDEVKTFFERIWSDYNRNTQKNTRWRTKEKEEYKKKILDKALEKKAKEEAKKLEVPIEALMKWKKEAIESLLEEIVKKKWKLNASDKIKILNALKTELWEPTTIAKSDNKQEIQATWPLVNIVRNAR